MINQSSDNYSKALVILSGGQDSTTALFWARDTFDEIHAVTFNYGQRHSLEIASAIKVAQLAGVKDHEVIDIPNCLVSSSPLTSNAKLEQYENPRQMEEIIGDRRELTFVPMRNGLFLTIAANRAEALGITDLVTGVCELDNSNYDDCRVNFIKDAENYINSALGHDHRGTTPMVIHVPLIYRSKERTVQLALQLPGCWEALAYTHTSYDGKYPPTDMNHANVLRADGFEKAGYPDPLVLRAVKEGLMEIPSTDNYAEITTGNIDEFIHYGHKQS